MLGVELVSPLPPTSARPRREPRTTSAPAPRTIRSLSRTALILIGLLTVGAIAALIWSAHASRRATDASIRATNMQALVDEAFLRSLIHRRLSDLYVVTADPELAQAREAQRAEISRALRRAGTSADDPRERALVALAVEQLDAWLARRAQLEARGGDLPTIVEETRPYLDRLSHTLARLHELERRDVRAAYAAIDRATLITDAVGATLAAVLLGVIVLGVYAIRRWVVAPVLVLHGTLERFRAGQLDARAPAHGVKEICELAVAYNAMADALATQRRGQLTYLAGVAHDLRNPLGTLKVGLAVIEPHADAERTHRTFELLHRQVDRISRMVNDLLDVTRAEAGGLEMSPEPLDLRERTREVAEAYVSSYPDHQIVLAMPDAPLTIDADPGRIDQVLHNLVSNALKFSPAGGQVELTGTRSGFEISLEVRDHGIGMTPEQMRDLYAPFRRGAPGVAPGAGLGLSIVRRIVEAHGGRIEVESAPEVGSVFRVVFPAARGGAERAPTGG